MNWKKVKLEEICEINMGKTPSRSNPKYWGEGHCWVSIADLSHVKDSCFIQKTKEHITDLAVKDSGIRVVPKNTLLYSFKLSIGKVAITQIPLFTNEAIVALPIKDENTLDIKYLYHAIQKVDLTGVGDKAVKGITLNKEKLQNLEIPLPDLHTQQHIAKVLDQADALRQQNRQLLAHYDELLQSTFIDLFGKDASNYATWSLEKIENIVENKKGSMRSGPFGSDLLHSEFVDSGIFVLGIDNVVHNRFEWSRMRYITEEKYQKLKRYTVAPGDLLISIMATVGRVAIVPEGMPLAINSKHLAAITLDKEKVSPVFIAYNLHSNPEVTRQIAARGRGAIMEGLNLGLIKEIKIKIPPLSLQQKFAQLVEQIEEQKAVVKQSLAESEVLFEGLLAEYFG